MNFRDCKKCRLTDLQGGDDTVEGQEDLDKQGNDNADDVVLKGAGDGGDVGEEDGDFTNNSGEKLDDQGDLGLDRDDGLRLVGGVSDAGDSRVDDGSVLLDLDEGGLQLIADDSVGAAVELDFNAGDDLGGDIGDDGESSDVRDDRESGEDGRSGGRGREEGGKGDEAEAGETHLDGWVLG
jgi:hypothetical protein